MRIELRRPVGVNKVQYRLYSKAGQTNYVLRWIDTYVLDNDCNCYQFESRSEQH